MTMVNGVAPKSSLSQTVKKIEGYVAANNTAKACKELKTFIKRATWGRTRRRGSARPRRPR